MNTTVNATQRDIPSWLRQTTEGIKQMCFIPTEEFTTELAMDTQRVTVMPCGVSGELVAFDHEAGKVNYFCMLALDEAHGGARR